MCYCCRDYNLIFSIGYALLGAFLTITRRLKELPKINFRKTNPTMVPVIEASTFIKNFSMLFSFQSPNARCQRSWFNVVACTSIESLPFIHIISITGSYFPIVLKSMSVVTITTSPGRRAQLTVLPKSSISLSYFDWFFIISACM